jgi:hypothetical protein
MTVRKLNTITGDIVTSGVQFTSGQDEIAQTIRTRLKLFLGEYFRDITDGTPWFQSILIKNGTLTSKDAILKQRIIQTEGVNAIVEFLSDYDIDSRKYSIQCIVSTPFGNVPLNFSESI